jgi:hypothetical protein
MFSTVSEKLIARFLNLPMQIIAAGPGRHKLRMVFPDQHHKTPRVVTEFADQAPSDPFETTSFGAVLDSGVHCSSSNVQEEPAGLSGLDGS